jgi:uncharacterized membrane protein
MDRKQLKKTAKARISGNIGILFVITLLVSLITGAAMSVPVAGQIAGALILGPAFGLALTQIYLGIWAGTPADVADVFSCFKQFWPAFKVGFLQGLFTFLWSLLLFIPGIIKSYAYSQAMFILADCPDIGAREALRLSEEMMKGHKMELFVLELSFLGWHLLGIVTCGLSYIYAAPYMSTASAGFYRSLCSAQNDTWEANL